MKSNALGACKPALLLGLALSASGCASANMKMDATKPISREFSSYKQDGQPIDQSDMMSVLEQLPASSGPASMSSDYRMLGMATGIPGGILTGFFMGQVLADQEPTPMLLYVGAPLFLVGTVFDILSINYQNDAVEAHNKSLQSPSAIGHDLRWQPALAVGKNSVAGGLRVEF